MISIVVPIYNCSVYLRDLIQSVLNQTYNDWELILVNDGSTDDSLRLCNEYANNNHKIKVIDKENGGPSSARNLGLKLASGEFITFIDADDHISNNYLQNLNADDSIDFVINGYIRVAQDSTFDYNVIEGIFDSKNFGDAFKRQNSPFIFHIPVAKRYKKNIIEAHNLSFDEYLRIAEDVLFNLNYICHCKKIEFRNFLDYSYIEREQSLVHQNEPIEKIRYRSVEFTRIYKERSKLLKELTLTKFTGKLVLREIERYLKNIYRLPDRNKRIELLKDIDLQIYKSLKINNSYKEAFINKLLTMKFYPLYDFIRYNFINQ